MSRNILKAVTALVTFTNVAGQSKERQFAREQRRAAREAEEAGLPQQGHPQLLPLLPSDGPEFTIVYPEGEADNIDLEPWRYPESFAWGLWCSATMITPRVALTAAHCVFDDMDGPNPTSNGRPISVTLTNSDPNGADFTTTIQEIRSNECWFDSNYAIVWGGDLAMLILEDEKPGAQLGVDYIDIWDDEVDGDITGETFALMGWGLSGPVSNPEQGIWDFHRGYNVVREVYENRIQYGFEDPNDITSPGLPLESVANNGDSGGSATIEFADGTRKLIGVCSNGYGPQYRDEDDPYNQHEYIAVGGWQRSWVVDNLNSLDLGARVEATDQNCHAIEYATCEDTNFLSSGAEIGDSYGDPCMLYTFYPQWCGGYDTNEFNSEEMCCACDGGQARDDEPVVPPEPEDPVQALVDAAADAADNAEDLAVDAGTNQGIIDARTPELSAELATAQEQAGYASAAALASADLLVQANDASEDVDTLNVLLLAAEGQYDAAQDAATLANQAEAAGSADKTAILAAANAITSAQADCQDELDDAQQALDTLTTDHPTETDAIAEAQQSVDEAQAACDELDGYTDTQTAIDQANTDYDSLEDQASAATSSRDDTKSDLDDINALYSALVDPETQFELWVESFNIPQETGDCEIQATRDTTRSDEYHFFIWYLVGDCTAADSEKVKFRKGRKFWSRWTFEYIGDMTDRYRADNRGKREFNLSTDGSSDRIAFAVESRRARNFKPRFPRGIDVTTI